MTDLFGIIEDAELQINVQLIEGGTKGDPGETGDPGEPFLYEDFTPEQLALLKGEKGEKGDNLEFNWRGIELGIRIEGETNYIYQDLQGIQGERGNDLEFAWSTDGKRLGVREKGTTTYTYSEDLTGPQGVRGIQGNSIEYIWDGTRLGVRIKGQVDYLYSDLKGEKGDIGLGLEYRWEGTQLGVRIKDTGLYEYIDLKGEKGDPGEIENLAASHIENALGFLPLDKTYVDNKVKTDVPAGAVFTDTVTEVVDNLSSTTTTSALSANQGNVLNDKKADKTYVDNKVKTDVPAGAVFTDTPTDISGKQDKLTAGENVVIANNTISATDTVYDDTSIQTELGKKADKTYVDNKVKTDVPAGAVFTDTPTDISGKQDKLTAGDNITITSNTISATDTVYDDTAVQAELGKKADKIYVDNKVKTDVPAGAVFTDTPTDISGKQDKLTAGNNITITNNTISATDTKYTHPTHTAKANGLYKVTVDNQGHVSVTSAVAKADITALGIPAQDTVVDISGKLSKSNDTLETYTEKIQATAGVINLSLANVFTNTATVDRTYSITNAKSGVAHSFTLIITMGATVRTLTFPSSVKWQGGETPDMTTASKTYVLTFVTVDGGTTWLGMSGGEF